MYNDPYGGFGVMTQWIAIVATTFHNKTKKMSRTCFIVKFIPKEEQQYAGTITLVTDVAGEEATFTCAVEGAGCDPTAGSCP